MINKIKEYFKYKKNAKTAKREIAKMVAITLPTINDVLERKAEIVKFVVKLTDETKNIEGEKLIEMVLNEVSSALQSDNARIVQILSYIAKLEPRDIQKIITHAIVETNENT